MQSAQTRVDYLPKTKRQLANEYECSPATITKWCRRIKIDTREMLTIPEVKKFYDHYDFPQRNVVVTRGIK